MPEAERGTREIEHTADWELEVWAPDFTALLEEAGRGMYRLMGVELADGPRIRRRIELEADDREVALVGFLSELLYIMESEGLGFDAFDLRFAEDRLAAELEGARIRSRSKEIKAVTYHRLAVRSTPRGLETRIVFDV